MKKIISFVLLLLGSLSVYAVSMPSKSYYRFGEIGATEGVVLSTGVQIGNNATVGNYIYTQCLFPGDENGKCAECCNTAVNCDDAYAKDDETLIEECETNYGKCIGYCEGGPSLPLDASLLMLLGMVAAYGVRKYRMAASENE